MLSRVFAALALAAGMAFLAPSAGALAQSVTQSDPVTQAVFSEIERRIIRDYFGGRHYDDDDDDDHKGKKHKNKGKGKNKGLPPGLAKRDSLPPGLQKQLVRNGRLPPGLEKRALPHDLASQLTYRRGLDTLIVDNNVVLVERATGVILDILDNVLTN